MARLTPAERDAIRRLAARPPLPQPGPPRLPMPDFLRAISNLPPSLVPPRPKPPAPHGPNWRL